MNASPFHPEGWFGRPFGSIDGELATPIGWRPRRPAETTTVNTRSG